MNEYVRAQELAVEGYSLDVIDIKKAAKDKRKLEVAQINKSVEGRIDKYIAENIMNEVEEEITTKPVKVEKKVKKEEKKD